jgi:hypothetical protein
MQVQPIANDAPPKYRNAAARKVWQRPPWNQVDFKGREAVLKKAFAPSLQMPRSQR